MRSSRICCSVILLSNDWLPRCFVFWGCQHNNKNIHYMIMIISQLTSQSLSHFETIMMPMTINHDGNEDVDDNDDYIPWDSWWYWTCRTRRRACCVPPWSSWQGCRHWPPSVPPSACTKDQFFHHHATHHPVSPPSTHSQSMIEWMNEWMNESINQSIYYHSTGGVTGWLSG